MFNETYPKASVLTALVGRNISPIRTNGEVVPAITRAKRLWGAEKCAPVPQQRARRLPYSLPCETKSTRHNTSTHATTNHPAQKNDSRMTKKLTQKNHTIFTHNTAFSYVRVYLCLRVHVPKNRDRLPRYRGQQPRALVVAAH